MAQAQADAPNQTGSSESNSNGGARKGSGFWTLLIGSIGVVYGDIGTSPLYALRESLKHVAANGAGSQRSDRHRLAHLLGADDSSSR